MTDFTPLTPIAVDMPGTAEWANAVQDNPVAITEGAPGAPRVQPNAISAWSATSNVATGTGFIVVNLIPDMVIMVDAFGRTTGGSGSMVLNFQTSDDNGATWGGSRQLFSVGSGDGFAHTKCAINMATGVVSIVGYGAASLAPVTLNSNAIRFTRADSSGTPTGVASVMVTYLGSIL